MPSYSLARNQIDCVRPVGTMVVGLLFWKPCKEALDAMSVWTVKKVYNFYRNVAAYTLGSL
jgi:hypothetical protein